MKVVLLLLVLALLQSATTADPTCSLVPNSTTPGVRIPFPTANDAKDYVVGLLAANYPFRDFMRRLAKMEDKYLVPLLLQIKQYHAYLSKSPLYDPSLHGEDFTVYC
jgi:hypothetical protein